MTGDQQRKIGLAARLANLIEKAFDIRILRAAAFQHYRNIEREQRAVHARIGELEGAWEGLKASRDRAREEGRMLLRRVAELEAKDVGGRFGPEEDLPNRGND